MTLRKNAFRMRSFSPASLIYKSREKVLFYCFSTVTLFTIYVFSLFFFAKAYFLQYIALWLLSSIVFLFFARNATVMAKIIGRPNVLEVPVYITVMIMGLSAVFGVFPLLDNSKLLSGIPSGKFLVDGFVLQALGLLSFWIGYTFVVKLASPLDQSFSKPSSFDFVNPNLTIASILYGFMSLLRIALILKGGGNRIGGSDILNLGAWEQWLDYLLSTNYFFVPLYCIQYARGKLGSRAIYIVIAVEIFIAMISGWSSTIIKILTVFFGTQALYKKQVSLKYLIIVAMLIVFTIPAIRGFRSIKVNSLASILYGIQTINESFDNASRLDFTRDLLMKRQINSSQILALIMAKTPEVVDYRPFEELMLSPFAFIPRVLWPNKPNYGGVGQYITSAYLGHTGLGSAAVTPAGGFYIYGGHSIVISGMLITGIVCALYTQMLVIPAIENSQVTLFALYIGTITRVFHLAEGSFLSIFPVILQTTIVYTTIVVLISIRKQ